MGFYPLKVRKRWKKAREVFSGFCTKNIRFCTKNVKICTKSKQNFRWFVVYPLEFMEKDRDDCCIYLCLRVWKLWNMGYEYAVRVWIFSTNCQKNPQCLFNGYTHLSLIFNK